MGVPPVSFTPVPAVALAETHGRDAHATTKRKVRRTSAFLIFHFSFLIKP
jgi:hypothetical protein